MNLHAIPREFNHPILPDWLMKGLGSYLAQANSHVRLRIYPSLLVEMQYNPNGDSYDRHWTTFMEDSIRSWILPQYFSEAPADFWDRVEFVDG